MTLWHVRAGDGAGQLMFCEVTWSLLQQQPEVQLIFNPTAHTRIDCTIPTAFHPPRRIASGLKDSVESLLGRKV